MLKRVVARLALAIAAVALTVVLVEGLSSALLLAWDLAFNATLLPVNRHVGHDPLLGWINTPETHLPDMYGPGIALTINRDSMRNTEDFEAAVPAGRVRVLCLGDSFTLGVGVADDETWCLRLAELDPRRQALNLGEGGYGIGQAYLKYVHHGLRFDHDAVVFAFIPDDFRRMQLDRFIGVPKQRLRLVDGRLEPVFSPVPEPGFVVPWLTYNMEIFSGLRAMELGRRLRTRLGADGQAAVADPARGEALARAIFESLHRRTQAAGRVLVLVLLPEGVGEHPLGERWRPLLARFAAERGIAFVDAYGAHHALPLDRRRAMLDPTWGHLSVAGNRFVADRIHAALAEADDGSR